MTTAALTVNKLSSNVDELTGGFRSTMRIEGLRPRQTVTLELSTPDRTLFAETIAAYTDGIIISGAATTYLLAEWAGTIQKITLSVWSHRVGQGTPLATAEQEVAL
jgi:hypothetical protein